VNPDLNLWREKASATLNPTNGYVNRALEDEEVRNVQQVADKAFYKRDDEWVDASLTPAEGAAGGPATEVAIDSEEFRALVDKLVERQQQSCLALGRNIELEVDGVRYRVR